MVGGHDRIVGDLGSIPIEMADIAPVGSFCGAGIAVEREALAASSPAGKDIIFVG